MRLFSCVCGNTLFFENTRCVACEREVGWCPACRAIRALEPAGDGTFVCAEPSCRARLLKCANYALEDVCNRCVLAGADAPEPPPLCDCCRFNETIPDLSVPGNRTKWARIEAAKRRLFHVVDELALPYGSAAEGFEPPLAFDFKGDIIPADGVWRTMGNQERVYTGHAGGKITLNIREADDAEREKLRVDMGEAQRTVIGHLRHEIGHYFWEVLVRGRREDGFRALFGDHENPTYAEALERHYGEGPPADWRARYISAYATMHPWEDWAETFAFYLDMVSVLETAAGLEMMPRADFDDLDAMLRGYRRIGLAANELNRTMGLLDLVPEVVVPPVVAKLEFVHDVVREARTGGGPAGPHEGMRAPRPNPSPTSTPAGH